VLRTSLLALESFSRWADGAGALTACVGDDKRLERALAEDRTLLRARLAETVADHQIADGLELASPDLADAVFRRHVDPATKRGRSAEQSLVRYVTRLASRPDLFGIAGAYLVGRFTDGSRLQIGPRSELQVRVGLDSGLLQDVLRQAAKDSVASHAFVVRRNRDAYRVGGRLRVATRKPGTPHHRLLEIRATAAVELALEVAEQGASVGSLISSLEARGTPSDHAEHIVKRLIGNGLLVPMARISVTGRDPTLQAIEALESLPEGKRYAEAIQRADAAVSSAPTIGFALIADVSSVIRATGVEVERRRCLQVNARRTGGDRLPRSVLNEMRRSIDLLVGMTPPGGDELTAFREAFERRFGTRRVRLLEALDPDFGIRLESAPGERRNSGAHGIERRRVLLELAERGRSAPNAVVELSDGDLMRLSSDPPAKPPGAFALVASLISRDAAAVASGDFQLVEPAIAGSSGARLLGRLCRGDAELEAHVRDHLRREAALTPDALLAEVSVAPETDAGLNVTQRPVLREWEIEYGGASGAPPMRRLEPSDLLVSVEDEEVVLHSARLERRVIPSCTTAMNPSWVSLPAARLLLSVAYQRTTGFLEWSWDELADAPALPRVTHGRTTFALRRWNVSVGEFAVVAAGTDAGGFRRLQEWRSSRGLPRVVAFDHPKSRLLVDFANVLSVDAFLAASRNLDILRFVEVAAPEQSPVQGPDGHYAHEFIVPFILEQPAGRPEKRKRRPSQHVSESQRRFEPGTEWLYANLYGPLAAADRVLVDHLAPLVGRLRESRLIDRWFFVRYSDPAGHLRVRFHGSPRELVSDVLPVLHEALAALLSDGLLYRVSLDTYEREIERYGGREGVELMEQIAEHDSDAVLAILQDRPEQAARRHLAVASLAGLYADVGLPLEARRACCRNLRTMWAPQGESLGALLGSAERSERPQLTMLVNTLKDGEPAPGILPLRKRSPKQRPLLQRMRGLDDEGMLSRPFDEIVCSLAHMSVNRLLRRAANRDELRVHDALAGLYEAQMARERSRDKPSGSRSEGSAGFSTAMTS
jgi:thiopeptide-type bacteriocin biosynthesis protein